MALLASLTSGISGLRTSQAALSVIGNNLANLNTTAFKSSRITFADVFSQTFRFAQAPTANLGGKNPIQVGSGAAVASIDTNFNQGGITPTGRPFDLALQGEGFFVLRTEDGSQEFYTRAGSFVLDSNSDLVDANTGLKVKGTLGTINIDVNERMSARATGTVDIIGNLDSSFVIGGVNQALSNGMYTVGGAAATIGTSLDSLFLNTTNYSTGDTIIITGRESNGIDVSTTFQFGTVNATTGADGTTLGELQNFISTNFGTATATITGGNLVLTSDMTGASDLTFSINDGATNAISGNPNTGVTAWPISTQTASGSGDVHTTTFSVIDQQGASFPVTLTFNKTAANTWAVVPTMAAGSGSVTTNITAISFNPDGSLLSTTTSDGLSPSIVLMLAGGNQSVNLNFGSGISGLSQIAQSSTAAGVSQDGFQAGFFASVGVNADGTITTLFTNGQTRSGNKQLELATFANASGLSREGNNLFGVTVASGAAVPRTPGAGQAGTIVSGALEGSNVDIAEEFTNLITAQRTFQANARTITTTDEVLQELVNIVR